MGIFIGYMFGYGWGFDAGVARGRQQMCEEEKQQIAIIKADKEHKKYLKSLSEKSVGIGELKKKI